MKKIKLLSLALLPLLMVSCNSHKPNNQDDSHQSENGETSELPPVNVTQKDMEDIIYNLLDRRRSEEKPVDHYTFDYKETVTALDGHIVSTANVYEKYNYDHKSETQYWQCKSDAFGLTLFKTVNKGTTASYTYDYEKNQFVKDSDAIRTEGELDYFLRDLFINLKFGHEEAEESFVHYPSHDRYVYDGEMHKAKPNEYSTSDFIAHLEVEDGLVTKYVLSTTLAGQTTKIDVAISYDPVTIEIPN